MGSIRHQMRNLQIPNLNADRATPISEHLSHSSDHGCLDA